MSKVKAIGEIVAEIPEIGPILSLATGMMFTDNDNRATHKLLDAPRTDLDEYMDTAVLFGEFDRRLLQ